MTEIKPVSSSESLHGHLIGRRFAEARNLLDETAKGRLVPVNEVQETITLQLSDRLSDAAIVRFGDYQYYLPTSDEMDFILTESQLDRKQFLPERFDCDDFAFILKGEISAHAYQARQLSCGICAGIIWGYFDWNPRGYHAVNWYLDNTGTLYFIEPQWDLIYPVEQCRKGVDLFLA